MISLGVHGTGSLSAADVVLGYRLMALHGVQRRMNSSAYAVLHVTKRLNDRSGHGITIIHYGVQNVNAITQPLIG